MKTTEPISIKEFLSLISKKAKQIAITDNAADAIDIHNAIEMYLSEYVTQNNTHASQVAVSFKDWCDMNEQRIDFYQERNHTTSELYEKFKEENK